MRHRNTIALFVLFFLLLAALTPESASAATRQTEKAVKQPVSGQSRQVRKSRPSALAKAEAEFEALRKNKTRGALRENWVRLETRFRDLTAKSVGETAARAALYVGHSRAELGRRSFSAADHRLAVQEYADAASLFRTSKAAPAALLGQASVLINMLGEKKKGRVVLEGLLKRYPHAAEADDAREMLAVLSGKKSSEPLRDMGESRIPKRKGGILEQLGLTVQTIMLDAGHGGKDSGCMAGGLVEREFTLNMVKRVGALLRKRGFTVLYTRMSNKSLSLQDRPDMANARKADLFISIHLNANKDSKVRGLETYYLDEAKTSDAVTVAARENAVSVREISDLQFILTDLMLSSKVAESHELASCVHEGILSTLRKSRMEAYDNGVRGGPFYVLTGARMPAILVEFGYATNGSDALLLQSGAYLQRQTEGLVAGIASYKSRLARVSRR